MTETINDCMLYLLTPERVEDLTAFAALLDETLAGGDVACLQLRLKDADDEQFLAAIDALMPVAHKHGVAFIINDRAHLALERDVDGVHLGQGDMDAAAARKLLGAGKDIGVTCHDSIHLGFDAGAAGANYVAFGAFFNSHTKNTSFQADPSILTVWDEVTELPSVAIGGITPENCKTLIDAGAHFIAVCGAVWNCPEGPAAAVRAFDAVLKGQKGP